MQLVVLSDDEQFNELTSNGVSSNLSLIRVNGADDFLNYPAATAFMDLMFKFSEERIDLLKKLLPKLVIINAVANTLQETNASFVRINGWKTFLSASTIEAACIADKNIIPAEDVFKAFEKKINWLPDNPGFIAARVVSMIINEAYVSLEEGVSSKEDIDIAMKLGTNYPYGPFDWAHKIGLKNIIQLLQKLNAVNNRYIIAPGLAEEAVI